MHRHKLKIWLVDFWFKVKTEKANVQKKKGRSKESSMNNTEDDIFNQVLEVKYNLTTNIKEMYLEKEKEEKEVNINRTYDETSKLLDSRNGSNNLDITDEFEDEQDGKNSFGPKSSKTVDPL